MKTATIFHLAIGLLVISLLGLSPQASAQDNGTPEQSEKYSREELAQMLAPIALYPDALLSQILMASTYPIEVIEADRWVKKNSELKDEPLDTALLDKEWDPSVKATCHFPSILALMSERITETTNLGNAFLAQEAEVVDMVQELRARAKAQGNLTSNSKQKVVVEKETIIIEPADPRVVYVPYYDPFSVYGPWWYPAYPPFYWGPPVVSIGVGVYYWPAFYFGFPFVSWSYFDWHLHSVHIVVRNRPRYVRQERWIATPNRWQHLPRHRRGVAYRDKPTARKYGQTPVRSRTFPRDTRGFPEQLNRDLNRIGDARIMIDPNKQLRDQQERQLQEQKRINQELQRRQRIERARDDQKSRKREQANRVLQERQQINRDKGVDRNKQMGERTAPEKVPPKRIEREQQQRSRDTLFNQMEDGGKERQSSERGRISREGRGGNNSRNKGRSERNDMGGRDNNRGRSKR